MSKLIDLTGQTFGYLTVIERFPCAGKVRWVCRCVCGKVYDVNAGNLSKTKSCGCMKPALCGAGNTTHNQSMSGTNRRPTRTYAAWQHMKKRCLVPSTRNFHNYGGRGIRIHQGWVDDFQAFFAHMGECPPGLTLDRIDNSGNYEPGNCRWTDQKTQTRNSRANSLVDLNDGAGPLPKVVQYERYGNNKRRVLSRLRCGWGIVEAFTKPATRWRPRTTGMPKQRVLDQSSPT